MKITAHQAKSHKKLKILEQNIYRAAGISPRPETLRKKVKIILDSSAGFEYTGKQNEKEK